MKLRDKLPLIANEANAIDWDETADKFILCIDLLGISAWHRNADYWVDRLEAEFRAILA